MKQLKKSLFYILWTIVSVLLSVGLNYLILGKKPISKTKLMLLIDWVYEYVLFVIGGIRGLICTVIFFIINHYFIKQKIEQKKLVFSVQFLVLLLLTFLIAKIHYLLEFDLDYI